MDAPNDWSSFVLLLVDIQEDFWSSEHKKHFPNFTSNISKLLNFSRQAGLDIVHVRAEFEPDRSNWIKPYRLKGKIPCLRVTSGASVLSCATEKNGEPIIYKHSFDAFFKDQLLKLLFFRNKSFILLAGLQTSVCILFTAASAVQRGFSVAVIEDCCADHPSKHEATITGYPFIFERTLVERLNYDNERWLEMLENMG